MGRKQLKSGGSGSIGTVDKLNCKEMDDYGRSRRKKETPVPSPMNTKEEYTPITSNKYHRSLRFKATPPDAALKCPANDNGDGARRSRRTRQMCTGNKCATHDHYVKQGVECGPKCHLGPKCDNRSLSNARGKFACKAKVESGNAGKKVITNEYIQKGSFVIEYIGEVSKAKDDSSEYTLKSKDINSSRSNIEDVYICADRFGNEARFINHSCDPNLHVRMVEVDGRLCAALYANRNIRKGEELTYSYCYDPNELWFDCVCGSHNCISKRRPNRDNDNEAGSDEDEVTTGQSDVEPIILPKGYDYNVSMLYTDSLSYHGTAEVKDGKKLPTVVYLFGLSLTSQDLHAVVHLHCIQGRLVMETKDQFRFYFHDTDSQLVRVTDQNLPAIMNHRLFKDGSRLFSPFHPDQFKDTCSGCNQRTMLVPCAIGNYMNGKNEGPSDKCLVCLLKPKKARSLKPKIAKSSKPKRAKSPKPKKARHSKSKIARPSKPKKARPSKRKKARPS